MILKAIVTTWKQWKAIWSLDLDHWALQVSFCDYKLKVVIYGLYMCYNAHAHGYGNLRRTRECEVKTSLGVVGPWRLAWLKDQGQGKS